MHKRPLLLIALLCVAFFAAAFLVLPRNADAQCGSSASSCKNCHEIQAKAPVNTQGEWHTQHAFGDFCEFCHAGNVKAKDQTAAHTGMVEPLADVQGSCQSCHPDNYMDRAQTYATALGVTVGAGGANAQATPAAGAVGTTASGGDNTACGPTLPTTGQVIDVNKLHADMQSPDVSNLGNFILLGLIGMALIVLFGLLWHYEKPLPRLIAYARDLVNTPVVTATTPEGVTMPIPTEAARRPEFAALERALAASDPATVRAVTIMLSDRENGPKVLKALSNMDLATLDALGETDQKALEAVLKLAQEMNS